MIGQMKTFNTTTPIASKEALPNTWSQQGSNQLEALEHQGSNPIRQTPLLNATKNLSHILIGIIDTGFSAALLKNQPPQLLWGCDRIKSTNNNHQDAFSTAFGKVNNHGSHILDVITTENQEMPVWLGNAVGSGRWAESLVEFVDTVKILGSQAVMNLSFDLIQVMPDGYVTTRNRLTLQEQLALEYARQSGVLIVVAAGNTGQAMSALGQAAQHFDHIIPVGAAEGNHLASYSSHGPEPILLADGNFREMKGTSIAAARITASISKIWAANPELNHRQVIKILKSTTDLDAAIHQAVLTTPISYKAEQTIFLPTYRNTEGIVLERPAIWGVHIPIVDDAIDAGKNVAEGAVGLVTDGAQALGNAAVDTAQVLGNAAIDGAQIVGNAAIDSIQTAQNTVIDTVQLGIGAIGGDTINQAIDDAQSAVNGAIDTTQSIQNTIVDGAQSGKNTIINFVQGISNQGFDLAQELTRTDGGGNDWFNPVKDSISWGIDQLGDGIALGLDKLGDGTDLGFDLLGDGADWGLSAIGLDSAGKKANQFFDKAGHVVDAIVDDSGIIANGVLDSIAQGPEAFAEKVSEKLQGILQRGVSVIHQSPDRLKQLGSDYLDLLTSLGQLDGKGAAKAAGRITVDAVDLSGVPELAETAADLTKFNTRKLTPQEVQVAKSVFGDSINYDLVRIDESARSVAAAKEIANGESYRPFTTFHTINTWGAIENSKLIHELTHVWQYEQDGAIYIAEALAAQHSDEKYAYGGIAELEKRLAQGEGLTSFNREQQGKLVEHYYELRTKGSTQDGTISDPGVLPLFDFFVQEVSTVIKPTFAATHTTLNGKCLFSKRNVASPIAKPIFRIWSSLIGV